MSHLDGIYRHLGTAMVWDAVGLSVARPGVRSVTHSPWSEIIGARRIGARPGHVQVIVSGHVPPADPRDDPFSIAVASEDDAFRIVTNLEWNASVQATKDRCPSV
jgi:hypothetical protein